MYATHTAHSSLQAKGRAVTAKQRRDQHEAGVEISDAADLAPKDGAGSCNPFVEVEFDDQKQRIAAKPGDRSPYWNHTLHFGVRDPARLPSLPIDVFVHHDQSLQDHHTVRPYTFLGRVRISGASLERLHAQLADALLRHLLFAPMEIDLSGYITVGVGLKAWASGVACS